MCVCGRSRVCVRRSRAHQLRLSSREQQIGQVVVPGQAMRVACLSAAAEHDHLLGCLCAFNSALRAVLQSSDNLASLLGSVPSRIPLQLLCSHTHSLLSAFNPRVDRTSDIKKKSICQLLICGVRRGQKPCLLDGSRNKTLSVL